MVNNQTSQYKLLNFIFYMSCLGVFQYVRDILQVTVLIDHPVFVIVDKNCPKVHSNIKHSRMTGSSQMKYHIAHNNYVS